MEKVEWLLQQAKWLVNRVNDGDTCSCLCGAVHCGFVEVAQSLLAAKAHLNELCIGCGHTPLTKAVRGGHEEIVRLLLEQPDIAVDVRAGGAETALQIANRCTFQPIEQQLLQAKASAENFGDCNSGQERSRKLMVCFLLLFFKKLIYLLQDITLAIAKDDASTVAKVVCDDRSLLHAPLPGNDDYFDHRLRSPGFRHQGVDPLSTAVRDGRIAVVNSLLQLKANVNQQGRGGETPLFHAASEKMVALLLAQPDIVVDFEDDRRETPLHKAAKAGRVRLVQQLLEGNASVDSVNERQNTALTLSCQQRACSLAVVQLLLQHNADVNRQTGWRATALHFAAQCAQPTVVAALLDAKASVDVKNRARNTPLMAALSTYVADKPQKQVQRRDPELAGRDLCATVKLLLAAGATVCGGSVQLESTLIHLSLRGLFGVVRQLLRAGGYPLTDDANQSDDRPTLAQQCLSLLLDAKVDINRPLDNGETIFLWAVRARRKDIALLLLENGADATIKNTISARQLAVAGGQEFQDLFRCNACEPTQWCCLDCRTKWCRVDCDKFSGSIVCASI